MKHLLSLALAVLLLTGCSSTAPPAESTPPPSPPPEDQSVFVPVQLPEPEPDPRQETIDRLMASMTLEEKVGQLFSPAVLKRRLPSWRRSITWGAISSLAGTSRTPPETGGPQT